MGKKGKKTSTNIPKPNPNPIQTNPISVINAPPQPSVNEKNQLTQLINQLEQARGGSRAIIYWLLDTARISEAVVPSLYDQLSSIGKQPTLDLVLFTRGGDVEAPWRIVTLIREFCAKFSVLVPYYAYSSGTLLAMGADEIIMTPLGVLGPIDPSRTHPLLPRREGAEEAEPISVQDMRHAMRFILETAKPGADIPYTPEAMAQIVIALFDKIHPLVVGAIEQSYALSKLIGTRCLNTHMVDKKIIDDIVNKLCDEYKSHAYPICRKEARDIGLNAIDAPPNVDSAMINLLKFYTGRSINLPTSKPVLGQTVKMYMGWLDSNNMQIRAEAEMRAEKDDKLKLLGDKWVAY
jgi:hypothetical protein